MSERLPAFFQPVALIHERTWLNTGDNDININKVDAGYRQEFGDCWATAGSHRAMTLDAFTHWMPLPPAPGESAGAQPSNEKAVDAFAALLASHQRLAEALRAFMALDKSFATTCDDHLDEIAKKNPMGVAVKLARSALASIPKETT